MPSLKPTLDDSAIDSRSIPPIPGSVITTTVETDTSDDGVVAYIDEDRGAQILLDAYEGGRIDSFSRRLSWIARDPLYASTDKEPKYKLHPLIKYFLIIGTLAVVTFLYVYLKQQ